MMQKIAVQITENKLIDVRKLPHGNVIIDQRKFKSDLSTLVTNLIYEP